MGCCACGRVRGGEGGGGGGEMVVRGSGVPLPLNGGDTSMAWGQGGW